MEENLELYKYFYEVAKTGNISAAAKNLYTSQPVVSKYIGRLERELNAQLFIRNSRGVRLTDDGAVLYEHVKTAFEAIETGRKALDSRRNLHTGHIRIGVSTTLCKYMLLPYIKQFVKRYPNMNVSIHCQSSHHTLKLLDENKIDIGFTGRPDDMKSIRFFKVSDIEDTFVVSKSYMQHTGFNGTLLLENAPVMMLDKENMTRRYIENYLRQLSVQPQNIIEVSTMDLIIEFSKIGLGCGCVIKQFVAKELSDETLIEIKLPMPVLPRQVGFAIKNQTYMTSAVSAFLELFF